MLAGAVSGDRAFDDVADSVERVWSILRDEEKQTLTLDQDASAYWYGAELKYLCGFFEREFPDKTALQKLRAKAIRVATEQTERDTFQAMEALVHNLNTMHCLRPSAKVWARLNGDVRIVSVGELYERFENDPFEVLLVNRATHRMEWKRLLKVTKLGAGRDMVKIATTSGQEVETTDNHLYLNYEDGAIIDVLAKDVEQVLTPRGFVLNEESESIDVSDFAEAYKNSPFQEARLRVSEALAKLFGLYVGDGSVCGGSQMVLTICDKLNEKETAALVEEAFGFKPTYKKLYYGDGKLKEYRFNVGTRLANALKNLCGVCACEKKVPSFVVEGSDSIKKAFLCGYSIADGCKTREYFEASSVSRDLISGLRLLLLQLKEYPTTNKRSLATNGYKSQKTLYTITLGRKASRRLGLVESDGDVSYEAPKYDLRAVKGCGARRKSGNVLYREFEAALETDEKLREKHGALVNYFIGTVKEKVVDNSGEENVYDLSVEDNENFLTEDCVLIHNSRAGAQVPFSSINYGTDTSAAGRLVVKSILRALEAGLGAGETPIFPIHIFRVKKGVNAEEGSPNYDLFKLACKVSAKRMFPNFSFQDAPYNLRYYEAGRPETEIAYMGCLGETEVVTYRINGDLFVESAGRFWKRVAETNDVKTFGVSEYFDVDGVEIYDSSSDGFVKVNRLVKNPDKGDWTRVTFENGRSLYLTEDHALPVEGKGRTLVRDMELGDAVPAVWSQYHVKEEEAINAIPPDTAWALGVILCDGCYKSSLCVSLGLDERDVVDKFCEVLKENLCLDSKIVERERGSKGKYYDVKSVGEFAKHKKWLANIFGGVNKIERRIPVDIFALTKECRVKFLCGMIDADGYVNKKHIVNLGSTNRELALQQAALAQSLGIPCKVYCNRYAKSKPNNIRYLVNFALTKEIWKSIVSSKKRNACLPRDKKTLAPPFLKLTKIEKLGTLGESSYCVETESDRFDVSGINSHNCRTRVIGNVYDPENEISFSRGNLSFTSINLPRVGLELRNDPLFNDKNAGVVSMEKLDKVWERVEPLVDACAEQLYHRFELQCARNKRNYPFMMGQNCWLGAETLNNEESLRPILSHGTLSVEFVGLAEMLYALFGGHHGEYEILNTFGLKLIGLMRAKLDAISQEKKLNYTLLATPAEGLSGRFLRIDRERYGIIPGVTDKEFYTNSFHVPVEFPISIGDKIRKEAPYHELTNAGHITYVELNGDPSQNLTAFEKIVVTMMESGIGYGAINHPIDRDPDCGYEVIIDGDVCPKCGRKETKAKPFERIRRITGYLVGGLERFNDAKRAEESLRVKHG
ncbi:MAG: hypothetical protein IJ991_03825 [Thermoguttaceae bacterium]|nr:hypothetical protein [Thermoguttaceae bacterium]